MGQLLTGYTCGRTVPNGMPGGPKKSRSETGGRGVPREPDNLHSDIYAY